MEQIISCPNCGTNIDVNHYVNNQLEIKISEAKQSLQKDYDKKLNEQKSYYELEQSKIDKARHELDKEKATLNDKIEEETSLRIIKEKENMYKQLRSQFEKETTSKIQLFKEENSYQIQSLQEELAKKNEQVKENFNLKLEIEKIKRESEMQSQKINLEKEIEFNKKLDEERHRLSNDIESQYHLKFKAMEKKLEDQTKLAEEMKRKAEQGSMQLQGEIQELELENIIKQNYPYDKLMEIKKGQSGADLVHIVVNDFYQECGQIYYESKRTKTFSNEWIKKLKEDNKEQKADILVIASEAMPQGKTKYYYDEAGVWVCNFNEIKPLIMVLRQSLIEIQKYKVIRQGGESKKELLYNYLTSIEFHNQLESIISGFRNLEKSYSDEKLRMQKIWKEREKQLDSVLLSTVEFYGALRGIAGHSIQSIQFLEDESTQLLAD
ncbi:MAG TPA: DUF2130 domain-containing protein [Candidatus Kapabacteria bacterium]|nr:DUF2130 domain-containing protein [Candidatus Kapabacteria bacterium]